ncbi:MAG: nickel transporter, partial [Streptomyces sp.]
GNGYPHPQPHAHPHDTPNGAVATLTRPATEPEHDHSHEHSHPHGHSHPPVRRNTRRGLIGVGIAGGLVPSPSALVVLLGALALGRTAFGVLLVLGYGLGMALTLTAAGLLLVRVRDTVTASGRLSRLIDSRSLSRLTRWGPALTACLVLTVGLGLTARAALGAS